MALIPCQHLTARGGVEVGCCGLALRTEGQRGRAGESRSLGNWVCPTSPPEDLADEKDPGARCSPRRGRGGKRRVTRKVLQRDQIPDPQPQLF